MTLVSKTSTDRDKGGSGSPHRGRRGLKRVGLGHWGGERDGYGCHGLRRRPQKCHFKHSP